MCNCSRAVLLMQCYNYSHGLVTGSFCRSLCADKEIEYYSCLGRRTSTHVIEALWRERWKGRLVLKVDTDLGNIQEQYFSSYSKDQLSTYWTTRERITERLELSLQTIFGQLSDEMMVVVAGIVENCDIGRDGILLFEEEFCCWYFANSHEYVIITVLQDFIGIPALIGTCGNLYAMEYASNKPLMTPQLASEPESWSFRVALAVALIEMVEAFENTKYGTVYLCDMTPSNFGMVQRWDKRYEARSVDHRHTYPESHLANLLHSSVDKVCNNDTDCRIRDCLVRCRRRSGKCSAELTSNNLQVCDVDGFCLQCCLPKLQ